MSEKDPETVSIKSHGSRRLYRQGSLGSRASVGDIVLQPLGDGQNGSLDGIRAMRQRTPSGKSIRSRTASRAEYHEDLKPDLKQGLTRNLVFACFIIYIGSSFLFGYNIGVLNQPVSFIKGFYNETYTARSGTPIQSSYLTLLWALTTTMFLPGGMIGAFSSGYLADKFGRKGAVLFSQIFAILGAVVSTCCLVAKSPEMLMAGRFLTGINCGFATQLAPMYLAEITPFNLRGAFGTGHQLFITIGIFMGSVFGLREILGTVNGWPYLLLLNAVPAVFSLIVLPFLPESPRFLYLVKNKKTEAEKALKWYRQTEDVSADLEEMETESQDKSNIVSEEEETYTMRKLLTSKELRVPLFVAVFLQVIQQLSGINAVFFYSTGIYRNSGVSEWAIQYAVIGTNAVNVIMTIVTVPIIDKIGRRPLLLFPMIVMDIILIIITVALSLQDKHQWLSYVSIICVIAYVICFAVGLGPIPCMIGAELFRQGPRPRVMSLVGLTNWLFTMIVAISFENIQEAIGAYTFLIFLGLMVIFTVFVYFKVPETKNKTFEEIASQFAPGDKIEVEEVVDDVFDIEPTENSKMLGKNGSASSIKDGVKFGLHDEEKTSLTQSAENIHTVDA